MNLRSIYLLCGFVVAIAAIAGWRIAESARSLHSEPQSLALETHAIQNIDSSHTHDLFQVPAYAKERLRAIRAAGNEVEQLRTTIALANALPLEELVKWVEGRWFDDVDGFNLKLYHRIARQRLEHEAPNLYYAWLMREKAGDNDSIARGWAEIDRLAAVEYLQKHPNPKLELELLGPLAKKHPEMVMERLKMLGAKHPHKWYRDFLKITHQLPNPESYLSADLPDELSGALKMSIFQRKLETDFDAAIAAYDADITAIAWGRADLKDKLLARISDMPAKLREDIAKYPNNALSRENAVSWLQADLSGAGFTPEQTTKIREQAASFMNGEDALLALNEIEKDDDYIHLLKKVFSNHQYDLTELRKFSEMLTDEADKLLLSSYLENAENSAKNIAAEIQKPHAAPGATDYIEQSRTVEKVDGSWNANVASIATGISRMNEEQSREFLDQFRALPDEDQLNIAHIIKDCLSICDVTNQELAASMVAAMQSSYDVNDQADAARIAGVIVVRRLMETPATAQAFISKLPDGDAKLWAQKNTAYNWRLYDAPAADAWVKTLPPATRAEVQAFLNPPGNNQ